MILAAAFVAAQPLFDVERGLIGAVIGVGRHSLGFEHRAGIEMQHAFGAKAETVLADGGMAGIAAVEIFRRRFSTRSVMRCRNAAPTLMFFPETRKGI